MASNEKHGSGTPSSDKGGGVGRGRFGWLALGVVLIALGAYGCVRMKPRDQNGFRAPQTDAEAKTSAGAMPSNSVNEVRGGTDEMNEPGDTTPDLKDYIPAGQNPVAGEVIARLRAAGINTGIAAFNPPGTSPPLIGIAVPDEFPLPEGFVRHTQATDDGQRIEPILMFSPDYDFYDAKGRLIDVPEDRVVPPEHAPPGLKIRMIRIPPPVDNAD